MAKLPVGMTKRSDGRISYRFTVEGKRYSVYGSCVKECREKEMLKREEIAKGLFKTGKALTVDDYIEQWIESKTGTIKPSSIREHKHLLNRARLTSIDAVGTRFGQLKLTKVETAHVKALQKGLQTELKVVVDDKTKTYKPYSNRSINQTIYMLKTMFNTAVNEHVLTWNPANAVKPLQIEEKSYDTIHRALTKEETALFMKTAEKMNSWYTPLFKFLLNTGCRIGESGALLLSDLEQDGFMVRRTLTRLEKGTYIIGDNAKSSAGERFIPFNDDSKKAIEEQRRKTKELFGKVIDMNRPIFCSLTGCVIDVSTINPIIAEICDKAKIDRFTCHCFRDTFATRCAESGMPPEVLMKIMGHRNIQITYRYYVHTSNQTKVERLKVVNFM